MLLAEDFQRKETKGKKNAYALKTPSIVATTFVYKMEFHMESNPAGRKKKAGLHLHQSLPGCCCITTIHLIEKTFFDLVIMTFDLDLRT